ncbi:MAG: hypothetical protein ACE5QV_07435, partial [Fidelibacterota bacterium]
MSKLKLVLTFLCLPPLFLSYIEDANAKIGEWKNLTYINEVKRVVILNGTIWGATSGGLLGYNFETEKFIKYTNANGLSEINLKALAADRDGKLWIGAAAPQGKIDIFDIEKNVIETVDFGLTEITYIKVLRDTIFVGFVASEGNGILFFEYDSFKKEYMFKDSYKYFPGSFSTINEIFINKQSIYLATDIGVFSASLSSLNLKDPDEWEIVGGEVLSGKSVNSIAASGERIFFGTDSGVILYSNGDYRTINKGLNNLYVNRLSIGPDGAIYAATNYRIFKLTEADEWILLGNLPMRVYDLAFDDSGRIWAGTYGRAFAFWDEEASSWFYITPNGPAGRKFSALIVYEKGRLWGGGGGFFFVMDDNCWFNFFPHTRVYAVHDPGEVDCNSFVADSLPLPVTNPLDARIFDNMVWFTSFGGGLTLLDMDTPGNFVLYDTTDGKLTDPAGERNRGYVVVTDVERDRDGNIWIANAFAQNKKVLIVITPEGEWGYFSMMESTLELELTDIEIDHMGRIWVGANYNFTVPSYGGIAILDHKGTVLDKSDDVWYSINETEGLENSTILSLAEDKENIMWIVTGSGVQSLPVPDRLDQSYFSQNLSEPLYQLFQYSVSFVMVDVRNNKWFGTQNGGVQILFNNGTWLNGGLGYNTQNSEIIDDNIISMAFNDRTGDVYLGSLRGLSILSTPYTRPLRDLSNLKVYPNPFVIPSDRELIIEGLVD